MKTSQAVLCVVVLALSACAPRKDAYKQPVPPAPAAWNTGLPEDGSSGAQTAADVAWEKYFHDEKLRQVIQLALANNRDLRMAALNVERAEAQFRVQRAAQNPTVTAGINSDAYRMPADMTKDNKSYTFNTNRLGLQVSSWEVDLFGRIRSLKSAALEQYLATQQGRSATQIALVASVASVYMTMAADRDGLRLAQSTLQAQQATYDLVSRTRDLGIRSDLEVSQARSQVQAAEADVVRYTAQLKLDENALSLLAGAPVPESWLPTALGDETALQDIAAGLPSQVLLRRPDILQAEHQLRAAYANIAAARANFFPRITLTGAGGLLSGAVDQLFTAGARTWEFAPGVNLPIFDSGARKATYKIAQTDRDSAVASYEQAIQTAFREVSDSLTLRGRLLEQQKVQQGLVRTLEETYRLTDARYKAGIDNYLSVLVAQRSLYSGQQTLLNLRLSRMSNLVTLYKVLGGGA